MSVFLKNMVAPTLLMGWGTCYFIEVMGKPLGGRTLILPAYLFLAAMYAAILSRDYRRNKNTTAQHDPQPLESGREDWVRVACLAASIIYLAAIPYLGFPIATVLALYSSFHILGAKRKIASLLFTACFTGILYYVFNHLLYVPLPLGLLEVLRGY